jgi:hypothetical protein
MRANLVSRTSVTELVAICAGVLGVAVYAGLILIPAWTAYTRLWERLVAAFLSLYVLALCVGLGIGAAAAAIYFWG